MKVFIFDSGMMRTPDELHRPACAFAWKLEGDAAAFGIILIRGVFDGGVARDLGGDGGGAPRSSA